MNLTRVFTFKICPAWMWHITSWIVAPIEFSQQYLISILRTDWTILSHDWTVPTIVVFCKVQPPLIRERETEGTLDLSIKKPRIEYRETGQPKHSPLAPPHSVTVYRTASTHTETNYYHQVSNIPLH